MGHFYVLYTAHETSELLITSPGMSWYWIRPPGSVDGLGSIHSAEGLLCVPGWEHGGIRQLLPPTIYLQTHRQFQEKAMATHSSTPSWKILWTEEPGKLQSMGSQRVGHDWATSLTHSFLKLHKSEKTIKLILQVTITDILKCDKNNKSNSYNLISMMNIDAKILNKILTNGI